MNEETVQTEVVVEDAVTPEVTDAPVATEAVVEETSVLGIPSLQMRKATERPQTYDSKSSVKFDPTRPQDYPAEVIFKKLNFFFI